MLTKECKAELLDFLRGNQRELHVTLLPDFFQDRIVSLDKDPQSFKSQIEKVVNRKGGSIDSIPQTSLMGGNAINTALALAAMGASVTPIVCTDNFGAIQIKFAFKNTKADLSHIKILPNSSKTTALEFNIKKELANVMLRDLGGLATFGPNGLDESDFLKIKNSDYTFLSNWAGTRKYGTQLAKAIFDAASKGKGKTYFDTADPTPNMDKTRELVEKVLKTEKIDIFSLNENEASIYHKLLSKEPEIRPKKSSLEDHALESAQTLAKSLKARIDLHTTKFSATITNRIKNYINLKN